ncbi:MAG TPA: hypothetical protein VF712_15975 [Thermoleophilaceae bacterium]|jgi:hypothetical protein
MAYDDNAAAVRRLLETYSDQVMSWLGVPNAVVDFMEPGTISAVVNSLLEADFAHVLRDEGVVRCRMAEHHRDGYPDFQLGKGAGSPRVEMKGLWRKILLGEITSSGKSKMEPSARLREPIEDIWEEDVLLIVVWDFESDGQISRVVLPDGHPPVVCSAHAAAESRDRRAIENGAVWRPDEKIPVTRTGRPETNFGKLNRIPYVRKQLGLPELKVRSVTVDAPPEFDDEPTVEAPSDPELADELALGRDMRAPNEGDAPATS